MIHEQKISTFKTTITHNILHPMIETETLLNIIRLTLGILILTYASYTDIKTRRASNYLWIILAITGIILLIIQYFTTEMQNLIYLIFIPIMIGLLYGFYQARLLFGGADAKALMALSILVPLKPTILHYPLVDSFMPYPWIIFTNSILLFLFIPLSLLIYNITKKNVKFPHSLIGYKMSLKKAKKTFVWPLERIRDGKRIISILPGDIDASEEYKAFEQQGIKEIWVTPKIPFMIPLLAGYITTFIYGDLLSALFHIPF